MKYEYPEVMEHNVISAVPHWMVETWKEGKQYIRMYPKAYYTLPEATARFLSEVSKGGRFPV